GTGSGTGASARIRALPTHGRGSAVVPRARRPVGISLLACRDGSGGGTGDATLTTRALGRRAGSAGVGAHAAGSDLVDPRRAPPRPRASGKGHGAVRSAGARAGSHPGRRAGPQSDVPRLCRVDALAARVSGS